MANNIELFKEYIDLLDEVYMNASTSASLDGANELVTKGANAGELVIPVMTMDGLSDYDRATGYVDGDVTLTFETKKADYDRGKAFTVDDMDNVETAGLAFGQLAAEFIRTKVVPEVDAYRYAKYAKNAKNASTGTLATGAAVIEALRKASNAMDEAEVPVEGRELRITPTLKGMIEDLDTTKSKAVLAKFSNIIAVPQKRFNTKVTLGANGFTLDGSDINFLITHKGAVIQHDKHVVSKVISPQENQTADAWKFAYRNYAIAEVYDNKKDGIYVHSVEAVPAE